MMVSLCRRFCKWPLRRMTVLQSGHMDHKSVTGTQKTIITRAGTPALNRNKTNRKSHGNKNYPSLVPAAKRRKSCVTPKQVMIKFVSSGKSCTNTHVTTRTWINFSNGKYKVVATRDNLLIMEHKRMGVFLEPWICCDIAEAVRRFLPQLWPSTTHTHKKMHSGGKQAL